MGSTKGNVPALTDGGTHHSWCWDEKNMVWRTTIGTTAVSGSVQVKSGGGGIEGITNTITEGDTTVVGVVPQVEAADGTVTDQSIGDFESCYVQFAGDISKVNVVGAVAVGDFLITSTTPGRAKSCGTTWRPGIFGIATSSAAGPGNGTVSARLFPVHSQVAPWKPGDIKMHAGATLETGWLWCNGAAVSRTTYAALFAEIGTKYGAGDGSTFNVPDLQGRAPVGVGTHADVNDYGKNDGIDVGSRTPKHTHPQNYNMTMPDEQGTGGLMSYSPSGGDFFGHVGGGGTLAYGVKTGVSSNCPPFITVKFVIKT